MFTSEGNKTLRGRGEGTIPLRVHPEVVRGGVCISLKARPLRNGAFRHVGVGVVCRRAGNLGHSDTLRYLGLEMQYGNSGASRLSRIYVCAEIAEQVKG